MTRININGSGHQVEVDHDGADLTYVVEKAQRLWDETRPVGKVFGLSQPDDRRSGGRNDG